MSAYTSRIEAENMINVLSAQMVDNLKLLKDPTVVRWMVQA